MEWPADRGLRLRMVATLALVGLVAAAGAATYVAARLALWTGTRFAGLTVDAGTARATSAVLAAAFLAGAAASELWFGRRHRLPETDVRGADREFHPGLARHADRVAQQLDLPRPTVVPAADPAPLAVTTGSRPVPRRRSSRRGCWRRWTTRSWRPSSPTSWRTSATATRR